MSETTTRRPSQTEKATMTKIETAPDHFPGVGNMVADTPFAPVSTLDDLYTLDADQILDGYRSWNRLDPEPGANRGRAYWHGWCNAARDNFDRPATTASAQLAHAYLRSQRLDRVTEEQRT